MYPVHYISSQTQQREIFQNCWAEQFSKTQIAIRFTLSFQFSPPCFHLYMHNQSFVLFESSVNVLRVQFHFVHVMDTTLWLNQFKFRDSFLLVNSPYTAIQWRASLLSQYELWTADYGPGGCKTRNVPVQGTEYGVRTRYNRVKR